MNASAVAAARLVLVAPERPVRRESESQLRRYRLARARVAELRAPKHPQFARMHD